MSNTNQLAARKQKWVLYGGAIALFVATVAGLFIFGPSKPPEPAEVVREAAIDVPGGTHNEQELWRSQSEGMLKQIEDRIAQIESESKQKDEQIREFQNKISEIDKPDNLKPAMSLINDEGILSSPLPNTRAHTNHPGELLAEEKVPTVPQRQLVTVNYQPNVAPDAANTTLPDTHVQKLNQEKPLITSASFVRAVMISGLDAPTGGQASSDPLPVFFKLVDTAVLPNRFRSQVKACHAYGVGWGHIQSERAHIRLETLSCILKNGQHIDTPIKGHVIGEDGKVGVRGRLVSKQGQMIANGIMAGLASGIGQGFSSKFNTISTGASGTIATMSGDAIWKSGIGQGVGNGMDMLAQYYIRAAENLYPVIEVDSARTVELAFTKPLHIKGLNDDEYGELVMRNRGLK